MGYLSTEVSVPFFSEEKNVGLTEIPWVASILGRRPVGVRPVLVRL
jgi:hypothetical protein